MPYRNDRKTFLGSLASGAAVLALAARADAQPAASPAASAPPSPAPSPAASDAKPPSAAALAVAAGMRRFDPTLSDAEVASIARNIDDGADFGAALNPKNRRLRNWNEPVTALRVTE